MTQVVSEQNKKSKIERQIEKAFLIAKTKRVRHSATNRNYWFVQSGNPKTPKVWYCVQWSDFLNCLICNCPDYTYNCVRGDFCTHILACGFHEKGGE